MQHSDEEIISSTVYHWKGFTISKDLSKAVKLIARQCMNSKGFLLIALFNETQFLVVSKMYENPICSICQTFCFLLVFSKMLFACS